jgi:Protein of unknown function (DUF2591)
MTYINKRGLTGAALNWAVSLCEGYTDYCNGKILAPNKEWGRVWLSECDYSRDWAQGGHIIEREGIEICRLNSGEWRGQLYEQGIDKMHREYGETALIAAMRCYVSSKMGNQVDVPEELECVT